METYMKLEQVIAFLEENKVSESVRQVLYDFVGRWDIENKKYVITDGVRYALVAVYGHESGTRIMRELECDVTTFWPYTEGKRKRDPMLKSPSEPLEDWILRKTTEAVYGNSK